MSLNARNSIFVVLSWALGSLALDEASVASTRRPHIPRDDEFPKPLVVGPSQYFEGNDGPWSTFHIRVGTPEQDVRVLVSTASPQSMVVLEELGCSSSVFADVPPNCAVSRGTLFNPKDSSTWIDSGQYDINDGQVGLEANLGYSQPAQFGLDDLGIGLTGPVLKNQTVAGFATADPFYLGIFGLNGQPANFSSLGNQSAPSFLTTLKDQGHIPSLSWSYTAGARYRLKQVYGQLIFSGYDTSRFSENSVSFTMARDLTRDLVVVLQSVSYSGGSTSDTLLSEPIDIFIDSTDPNLWLPKSACDAFEKAFGLTLDDASGLYLVNESHHTQLLDSDAQVTFRLSDVTSGGDTVRIVLPYAAFDLKAEYPMVQNTSYYFPLKLAANATQYTLGRTFLQEAYLSADYERGVFNVSACTWVEGSDENIVTITSKDSSDGGDPGSRSKSDPGSGHSKSSLGGGAIAGIVVGVVAALALIVAAILFCRRRQRTKASFAAAEPEPDESMLKGPVHNSHVPSGLPIKHPSAPELDGDVPQIYQLHGESSSRQQSQQQTTGGSNASGPVEQPDPVYYELSGASHLVPAPRSNTTGSDRVSPFGTGSSPASRNVEADRISVSDRPSPPSPAVSTMGTEGLGASSDIVSPTTPVNRWSQPWRQS
ncbi:hypothetical protein PG993_009815 [Apiospora rasikravindrae]|uniref:Peptidase A1 domain-containing protein n=1 Tax=Apiospora rasikravindrae TaxID=990691 RepID=A0ABR1SM84_9PEZI